MGTPKSQTKKSNKKVLLFKLILFAALITIILSFAIFYANTHPPREAQTVTPAKYTTDYISVEFTTEDDIILKGWFLYSEDKSKERVIIICHGIGASKTEFVELAIYLSKADYNVLLFDFRAHGESGGKITSIGYDELKDLNAAVKYVKEMSGFKDSNIGLYGFSLGGSIAIMTAADNPQINAVIAESPFADLKRTTIRTLKTFYKYPKFPFYYMLNIIYKLRFNVWLSDVSPLKVIHKVQNIMIITGTDDGQNPLMYAKELYDAAKEPKEIWIIDGAGHGDASFFVKDYYIRIKDFFDKHLRHNA